MGFLDRLLGRDFKTVVLALDGLSYDFITEMYRKGVLKHLGSSKYRKMDSVYPTTSSVAWSSFMTGKNPGKHGVYGSADRSLDNKDIQPNNSSTLKARTLWNHLSSKKKNVFVMNVPMTYPPERVNGKLVSGFSCPDIKKGTYPREFASELCKLGYKIDVDSSLAFENLDKFLKDVHKTFDIRKKAMFHYMDRDWDFMMFHFNEIHRINHFMLGNHVDGDRYADEFVTFYKNVDRLVGQLKRSLDEDDKLMILSDHGFTRLEKEVQLNRWLMEEGYLEVVKDLSGITRDTKAYSLPPGRIYINLEGREWNGGVPKSEYRALRDELTEKLWNLRDPMSGREMVDKVFKREEIFSGPYVKNSPDILIHPKNGYDLKGKFGKVEFVSQGLRNGMHTYDNAFVYSNVPLKKDDPSILDLYPTVLDMMKIKKPKDLDGRSLLS